MKKSVVIIALFFIIVQVFGQMKIERSYCGLTIGKTTKLETLSLIECSRDSMIPFPVCVDENSFVYRGIFTVDGFDFSYIVAHYSNDTLYKLDFEECCRNANIKDVIKTFMKTELEKYSVLKDQFDSEFSMDSFYIEYDFPIPINKTDDDTYISILGNDYFVSYTVEDKAISDRISSEFVNKINSSFDANYSGENRVIGVGGLTFGESKETAMQKFLERGTLLESLDYESSYKKVSVGGVIYDYAVLYFSSENNNNNNQRKLISVTLQKLYPLYQFDLALQMYQSICDTYQQKYTNGKELLNQKDSRMSGYGMLSADYAEGKLYPIGITLQKSMSKGGSQYYYVTVSYFIDKIATIHNDDI